MDVGMGAALFIVGFLIWLAYVIQDQDEATSFCAKCHERSDIKYCVDCCGSGEIRLGKDWVTCHHQRFILFPRIVCLNCRQRA